MKPDNLLHAINDIDYEMVEEAENMMNRQWMTIYIKIEYAHKIVKA